MPLSIQLVNPKRELNLLLVFGRGAELGLSDQPGGLYPLETDVYTKLPAANGPIRPPWQSSASSRGRNLQSTSVNSRTAAANRAGRLFEGWRM